MLHPVKLRFLFFLAVAALCVGPRPLLAGPSGGARDAAANRAGPQHDKRERIRKRIGAMRAWRITEALALDEATAAKLFPLLSKFDDRFVEQAKRGAAVRKQLAKRLESPKPSGPAINALIDKLEAEHTAFYELQRDRFRAVRKVLTPEQAAKIVVMLPELDRKIRGEIRRAMRGNAGEGGQRRRQRVVDPFE